MDLKDIPESAYHYAMAEAYKDSLYATAKHLLGMHEVNPRTHGDMIKALEESTLRKLIVMPRGTFKTSLGSVAYPIWLLMRNPNLRILLDSELYTNSKNRLREIKQHIESEAFTKLFGVWKTRVWNESEIGISNRTRIVKEASITCSGIGAGKTGEHYDIVIADDLNSPKNSNTAEGCEKVLTHYKMYTSILDPGGIIVLIGTRYSAGDTIQAVIDNELTDEQRQSIGF